MNIKYFRAEVLIAIAICFCINMILINASNKDETSLIVVERDVCIEKDMVFKSKEKDLSYENDTQIEIRQETETIVTSTPLPTLAQTDILTPTISDLDDGFSTLKITTSKKTGTYIVMPNVNEDTLKYNIGWLPSSSLPGDDGLCVFMGHRDTDFRILKFIEINDALTVTIAGEIFNYKVTGIEIVNSDNELRFSTTNGCKLVLVTCYPFCYSGQAPKKLIVYAKIGL